MKAIFYDLETSDRNPVGQILNFAFLFVDEQFKILDECCGKMRLTRLQLPSPGAILANRIDPLTHNQEAEYSEKEGLATIWKFLAEKGALCRDGVLFVGYNSSRFDLGFLRTSMIRNGLSPYFKNFNYGDLLHLSKKLYMTHPKFPRPRVVDGDKARVSLSLQALCQEFELLKGKQEHESRADVILTIELAKLYRDRFGTDLLKFQAYEALPYHQSGKVIKVLFPSYDLDLELRGQETIYAFHQADHRYSLWLNLERYKKGEGRRALSWFKGKGDLLCVSGEHRPNDEELALIKRASAELEKVTVNNFFSESSCDIEQDIYRIDAQRLDLLRRAVWEREGKALQESKNHDLKTLYERHALANYQWGNGKDDKVTEKLAEYGRYRYGGRMLMAKGDDVDSYQEGVYSPDYHETLSEYLREIEERLETADRADVKLLQALRTYYHGSDLVKSCGPELLKIQRVKRPAEALPVAS